MNPLEFGRVWMLLFLFALLLSGCGKSSAVVFDPNDNDGDLETQENDALTDGDADLAESDVPAEREAADDAEIPDAIETEVPNDGDTETQLEADSDTPQEMDSDVQTDGDSDILTDGDSDVPIDGDSDVPVDGDADAQADGDSTESDTEVAIVCDGAHAGALRCTGSVYEKCMSNGNWIPYQDCKSTNQYCSENGCQDGVCTPDVKGCNDGRAELCKSDGQWQLVDNCAEKGQLCSRGTCGNARKAIQIAVSDTHNCALTPEGAAYCWGGYDIGSTQTPSLRSTWSKDILRITPNYALTKSGAVIKADGMAVTYLESGMKDVAEGDRFACALSALGEVLCWGENGNGELGDETTTKRDTPGFIHSTQKFVAINAGFRRACGLTEDGQVYCWGGSKLCSGYICSKPTLLTGLPAATYVAENGCSIGTDKALYCISDNATTQKVAGFAEPVVYASAGLDYICAIVESGAAFCWGQNDRGALGVGLDARVISTPTQVVGLTSGVTKINCSQGGIGGLTCALVGSEGKAMCWGYGANGLLGDGTSQSSNVPVTVLW